MLDLLQQGFGAVFSLNIMLLMLGGVAVGIVFGAVPGLSATMAVALCLPSRSMLPDGNQRGGFRAELQSSDMSLRFPVICCFRVLR